MPSIASAFISSKFQIEEEWIEILQIKCAAGPSIKCAQDQVEFRGHADRCVGVSHAGCDGLGR